MREENKKNDKWGFVFIALVIAVFAINGLNNVCL